MALVPGGAHLFAMPNKLPMAAEDYLAAQAAYRGWALFAISLFGAIAANLALGTALWAARRAGVAGLYQATEN